jgi:hypothetical protein
MSVPASSGQCWPNRFWIKWLAVFFGAVVLGMVVAAFTRPVRDTKTARIEVYVREGTALPQPAKEAHVYFEGADGTPKRETLLKPFENRTQEAGVPIKLVVFLVAATGKEQTDPYHIPEFKWPTTEHKIVSVTLDTKTHTGSTSINP